MSRILVTGAQGCIGSWVVKQFLASGAEVLTFDLDANQTRIDRITTPQERRNLQAVQGRIENTAQVKALVREQDISHIVHLAAVLMPFCQTSPVVGGLVNVIGTLNVFEAARDSGRDMRVVYASSSAVWGPEHAYEDRKLNEDDPLKPATHYGVFKQANEGNARAFYAVNGISSVGLRPWAVYGYGRDFGLTADPTVAIRAAVYGEPYQIRLSGCMDMQYVEDVADTFVRCLLTPLQGAHVFNLAGDVSSMDDFIGVLEKVRPAAKGLITANGPQVPVAYRMDDSQLQTLVPGIQRTPLQAGIERTVELYERNR